MADPPFRSIAVGLESDGSLRVLYNPCVRDNSVSRVKFVSGPESVDSNKDVRWDIEAAEPVKVDSFVLGELPEGFQARQGYIDKVFSIGQVQVFQTKGRDSVHVAFRPENLRVNEFLVAGKYLSHEEFFRTDGC
jgi:hypothetical protein